MIHTPKYLYYVLRSSEQEIDKIINDIDNYYYYFEKPKKKYGNDQQEKGKIKYRKLYPSCKELKKIQRRLNSFLQQNAKLPNYVYGPTRRRNNILNASVHRYNKYFFS